MFLGRLTDQEQLLCDFWGGIVFCILFHVSNNVFHPEFLKPTILCSQFFVGKEKSREHEHDTVLLYSLYLIDTETAAPALKMISKKLTDKLVIHWERF